MIINADKILNGLMGFYIVTALVLVAIAIVVYPSLRERAKKSK